MDKIIRCISEDGSITVTAADTSDIVFTAQKIHVTSPAATAALGRLLTASSLMGAQMKSKDASVTLRVNGDGPLGAVIAVGDSSGNCRGYVMNPGCETAYYDNGKINVSAAVGKSGILNVMKDFGSGDPYIGQVELVSGEIAEDITSYYAASEQLPTVCALGVLLNKDNHEAMLSGGFLIQLLPTATDESITMLEKSISKLEPVTTMLAKGMSIEDICRKALDGFKLDILDESPINYVCSCSREKVENSIRTLKDDEIRSLADELGYAEAVCHFCNKKHRFSKLQLEKIIEEKSANN